ncbi:MAG: metal ABC transporter permease [Candidatus Marinimicrobia bacterium]|nr:metal ABC transporter permease [Candidatus Neomarinimicrobiota bacterium]
MIELLFWPFMAALVISTIHVYLGLHVVTRGVIFVDLALAQVAAVGATVAFLLGLEPGGIPAYLTALAFTLLGAVLFTLTRDRKTHIPQEAIIGITYVVAAAVMILLLSKAPEGGEHITTLMVGSILFVTPKLVGFTLALYLVIGVILYLFRENFLAASRLYQDPEAMDRYRWWDFLFYATFGFVVTSAVQIVGILLVFSYLIIPAVAGMMFYQTWRARLIFGWILSIAANLLGMAASIWLDIPTGASIVATFGMLLVLLAVARSVLTT